MVTLNRIYTRTGDKGLTRLSTGQPVSKASLRVEAYGGGDENAVECPYCDKRFVLRAGAAHH